MEFPAPRSSPLQDETMMGEPTVPNEAAKGVAPALGLRQRAEAQFSADQTQTGAKRSPDETQQALYELQVHQIELEMQNEELRRTQAELEATRARYFDLYDLAPVGYLSVNEPGLILEANLTAATLLGIDRNALVKQPLTRFIVPEDQDIYYQHRRLLFAAGTPQACELRLARANSAPVWARLEMAAAQDASEGRVCHTMISDITAFRKAATTVQEIAAILEKRVADRTRELSTLYAVATITSQCLPLRAMLEQALAVVLDTLDGHSGAIHLLDEANRSLRLSAHVSLPAEVPADLSGLPLGPGLGSWVIEHDTPLVVPDVSLDPRCISTDQTEKLWETRTYVGVPMHVQGRCVGVLGIVRPAELQFASEAIALLSTLADQMAVAIENAQLREQAEQAAVMEERQRLARELHDSLIQALYSLTLLAETGYRQLAAGDQAPALEHLALVRDTAHQALKEMRLLVYELRPAALESEGLVGALQQRLEAVEQRAGIETQLQVEGPGDIRALGRQSSPLEEALYRIALEALNNAYRHATVTRITVRLFMDTERIELEITDNGQGFDLDAPAGHGGQGLKNMRERAEKLCGAFKLVSAPGQGTRVQAKFGLNRLGEAGRETA